MVHQFKLRTYSSLSRSRDMGKEKQTPKGASRLIWRIDRIPGSGLRLKEVLGVDWLQYAPEDSKEITLNAPISLDIEITKSNRDVFIRGSIGANIILVCSRCLREFDYPLISDLKHTLCPTEQKDIAYELELTSDDLEFSLYCGEEIDISQVVIEQIVLSVPVKPLCHNLCKGLCYGCGGDLNEGNCECSKEKSANIKFSKLLDFEVESRK